MDISGHGVINFKDWKNSYVPIILQEIYIQKIYDSYLSGKTDAVLLDLGSNISLWSMYASPFAKQIYAFEPSKESYDIGLKNITDNGIKNVKVIKKAVAEKDGKTTFYHSPNTTMNSLNPVVNTLPDLAEEVETIRLDTFVKQEKIERIDGIKCDVEGTESKLFASDSFINIIPIIDWMIYEWHEWDSSNPNIINYGLKQHGFNTIKQIPSDATIFACLK